MNLLHAIFNRPRSFNPCGFILGGVLAILLWGWAPAVAQNLELDMVADVKTRFSDGCFSIEELAQQAEDNQIDALVYGDYGRNSLEHGMWPFERIFKKKLEWSSVLYNGTYTYLSAINTADKKFENVLLIPGVENSPFYFWSGSTSAKNLTAHNRDKKLFVVGLPTPRDYEQLPALDSNLSTLHTQSYLLVFSIWLVAFLVSLFLAYRAVYRWVTVPLTLVFFLLTFNNHPFQSSPYNQYQGDQGIQPYQDAIDYSTARGGMTFWNHLDKNYVLDLPGWAMLKTLPHVEDLVLTNNYTGFQAIADEPVSAVGAGKEWDHVLMQFLQGKRQKPVWAFATADLHCPKKDPLKFAQVRTVLLAPDKTHQAVKDAMRRGRMYATRQPVDAPRLELKEFSVSDPIKKVAAEMGEELATMQSPLVRIHLDTQKRGVKTVRVVVVRNGEVVRDARGRLPYRMIWRDTDLPRKGRAFYRITAFVDEENYLVSNPVFVRFAEGPSQVASLPQAGAPRPAPVKAERSKPEPTPQPVREAPSTPPPPVVRKPVVERPKPPPAKPVTPPKPPAPPAARETYVVARLDGVALKKGPGAVFPQVAEARKGERLVLVRRTDVMFNGKPWLVVRQGNLTGYVWAPLVREE